MIDKLPSPTSILFVALLLIVAFNIGTRVGRYEGPSVPSYGEPSIRAHMSNWCDMETPDEHPPRPVVA